MSQKTDASTTSKPKPSKAKRERLSIDLEAYPDVKKLFEKYASERRIKASRTKLVIACLRGFLPKLLSEA